MKQQQSSDQLRMTTTTTTSGDGDLEGQANAVGGGVLVDALTEQRLLLVIHHRVGGGAHQADGVAAELLLHLHHLVGAQDTGRKDNGQRVGVHPVGRLLLRHAGQVKGQPLQEVVVLLRQLANVVEDNLDALRCVAHRRRPEKVVVQLVGHQRLGHLAEEELERGGQHVHRVLVQIEQATGSEAVQAAGVKGPLQLVDLAARARLPVDALRVEALQLNLGDQLLDNERNATLLADQLREGRPKDDLALEGGGAALAAADPVPAGVVHLLGALLVAGQLAAPADPDLVHQPHVAGADLADGVDVGHGEDKLVLVAGEHLVLLLPVPGLFARRLPLLRRRLGAGLGAGVSGPPPGPLAALLLVVNEVLVGEPKVALLVVAHRVGADQFALKSFRALLKTVSTIDSFAFFRPPSSISRIFFVMNLSIVCSSSVSVIRMSAGSVNWVMRTDCLLPGIAARRWGHLSLLGRILTSLLLVVLLCVGL
ncbi:hypothetical protein TYRP_022790 [Tyrophagus putrescentiae]|nr:hypothetical protein TYRP_022790 [Tyrophagus putrescentiae]